MTHDELVAEINKEIDEKAFVPERYYPVRYLLALRAVVELHKPFTDYGNDSCVECVNSDYSNEEQPYACPTIQAIEKELK